MKKKEQPKPTCPCCFTTIPDKQNRTEIRFWRVHNYDKTYYRKTGVLCSCGYIISNENY